MAATVWYRLKLEADLNLIERTANEGWMFFPNRKVGLNSQGVR